MIHLFHLIHLIHLIRLDKSYLVIKVREVKIVKEVNRSDDLLRFDCGDVFYKKCADN